MLLLKLLFYKKSFNDFLSIGLSDEFGHKIDIMALRPGYVATNLAMGRFI